MSWYTNMENWRLDKIDRNQKIDANMTREIELAKINPELFTACATSCIHCGAYVGRYEVKHWRSYPYMVCESCLFDERAADEHRARIELEEMMDIFEAVKGQQFDEWLCELDMEDWRDDMDEREKRNDPRELMLNYISCG